MIKGEPYAHGKITNKGATVYGNTKGYIHENLTGDRYPSTVIKFANGNNKRLHPTQKPTDLCEWLLKTYSNEGDLVLDFTMGSGSTIIACQNTKRNYIGIEMDGEIFKVAEKRINENALAEKEK